MKKQKIRVKLKSFDSRVIDKMVVKIINIVKSTGSKVKGPIPLPTTRSLYTVIKSVHKHKDSREQFQLKTFKRVIDVIEPNFKTVQSLSKINISSAVVVDIKN